MPDNSTPAPNVKQAVPFFMVSDIEATLRFYVEGLGFTLKNKWVPNGRIQWCWLELGNAAIMLQERWQDGRRAGVLEQPVGQGVSIYFICADALVIYHDLLSRGIPASRPFVGNGLWVTSVTDPDGYCLSFESPTDVLEETVYAG